MEPMSAPAPVRQAPIMDVSPPVRQQPAAQSPQPVATKPASSAPNGAVHANPEQAAAQLKAAPSTNAGAPAKITGPVLPSLAIACAVIFFAALSALAYYAYTKST